MPLIATLPTSIFCQCGHVLTCLGSTLVEITIGIG